MVRLTTITTRTGDEGATGLGDGRRVPKTDARIAAMGSVDEANAVIGVARLSAGPGLDPILAQVQNDLFDLGADLSLPDPEAPGLRVGEVHLTRVEEAARTLNARLPPLTSFVLPGGTPAAAHLHLARTVVRRAERDVWALCGVAPVNPAIAIYLNRLSDLLFIASRTANDQGVGDVLWIPGGGPAKQA